MIKIGGLARILTIPPIQAQSETVISAGAFTPTDVSGLKLWLDANDITTLWTTSARSVQVASDADPVGAWDDKSGNGNNVLQATSSKRSTYKTSIQNSKPIVRFDGTDDRIGITSMTASTLFASDVITAYIVLLQDSVQANNTTFAFNTTTTNRVYVNATYANVIYFDHPSSSGGRVSVAQPAGWDDAFHIVEVYRNGTSDTEIKVDNTSEVSSTTTGTLNTATIADFMIASYPSGADYHKGDIAEILIYNVAVSSGDRASIHTYLNDKWAVY